MLELQEPISVQIKGVRLVRECVNEIGELKTSCAPDERGPVNGAVPVFSVGGDVLQGRMP